MPIIRHAASVLLLIALTAGSLAQASVISIGSLKDNTLYEDAAGALSNGAGQRFFVGRPGSGGNRRGLIAFDIAGSIPAGATINNVSLRLNMTNTSAGDKTIELRASLQDWGQGSSVASGGEGGGGPAALGDATWRGSTPFTTPASGTHPAATSPPRLAPASPSAASVSTHGPRPPNSSPTCNPGSIPRPPTSAGLCSATK
jgi:hypothetical protein